MTDTFNKYMALANCLLSGAGVLMGLSNAIWQWQPDADRLVSVATAVAMGCMSHHMYRHWKRR